MQSSLRVLFGVASAGAEPPSRGPLDQLFRGQTDNAPKTPPSNDRSGAQQGTGPKAQKRKSACANTLPDGEEKAQTSRAPRRKREEAPAEERAEQEARILDQINNLGEAADWDKAAFNAAIVGVEKYMEGNVSASSVKSYCGALRRLFTLHQRSLEVMASTDYCTLIRNSPADKKCNHCLSAALKKFSAFYTDTLEKNGGSFKIDPTWESTPFVSREPVYDAHGELRQRGKGASKYVGVYWHDSTRKWLAVLKSKYVGLYLTEESAAEARQRALGSEVVAPAGASVLHLLFGGKPAPKDVGGTGAAAMTGDAKDSLPGNAEANSGDKEVAEVSGVISIVDPILQTRIETPVRGKNCDHVGVFDKEAYVEFNAMQAKRTTGGIKGLWKCPICNKPAPEKSLLLAKEFVEVLAAARDYPELEHVAVQPDGSVSLLR